MNQNKIKFEGVLEKVKNTAYLRLFGLLKVPMIFWVSPRVELLDQDQVIIKIPLSRRTKNHLGSMYFGTLAVGADCAGGLLAMKLIRDSGKNIGLVFKDFKAEFLKRPDADVFFICSQGSVIRELVQKTLASPDRQNQTVLVQAQCKGECVAKFELTLSLKNKS